MGGRGAARPAAPAMPGTWIHTSASMCRRPLCPFLCLLRFAAGDANPPPLARQTRRAVRLPGFPHIHGRQAVFVWMRFHTVETRPRNRTAATSDFHTVQAPAAHGGKSGAGPIWAVCGACGAVLAGWNLPSRAVARPRFFIPALGRQGPLLRGIGGLRRVALAGRGWQPYHNTGASAGTRIIHRIFTFYDF